MTRPASNVQIQDFFPPAMFTKPEQTFEEAEAELHQAVDAFKAFQAALTQPQAHQ